eukprot:9246945-Pyramimonas_sp.AAC.1
MNINNVTLTFRSDTRLVLLTLPQALALARRNERAADTTQAPPIHASVLSLRPHPHRGGPIRKI